MKPSILWEFTICYENSPFGGQFNRTSYFSCEASNLVKAAKLAYKEMRSLRKINKVKSNPDWYSFYDVKRNGKSVETHDLFEVLRALHTIEKFSK